MKIVVPKESDPLETRVAATPDVVKKWSGWGIEISVEKDAGQKAFYSNELYESAGSKICEDLEDLYKGLFYNVKSFCL